MYFSTDRPTTSMRLRLGVHHGEMRISPVLSLSDLPPAELQAAVLDGELVRIGDAFCAVDTIINPQHRAASIATEVPAYSIAERLTAAWIHGAIDDQPNRLQLCVTTQSNVRPTSSARYVFREVVISDDETTRIGGLPVTTPMRTALDLARIDVDFSAFAADAVRKLAVVGQGFDIADCMLAMASRRNLPHKRVALIRLSDALQRRQRSQPALTR